MTLTTILGFLGVAVLLAASWATYKATKGSKVAEASSRVADASAAAVSVMQTELNAYEKQASRLDGELKQANQLIASQTSTIENLRQRTDLQPIMERLAAVAEETGSRHQAFAVNTEAIAKMVAELVRLSHSLTKKVDAHEQRAQERHEKTVAALERIANPDAA